MKQIKWLNMDIEVLQSIAELQSEDMFFKRWYNRGQVIKTFAENDGNMNYKSIGSLDVRPGESMYTLYKCSDLENDAEFLNDLDDEVKSFGDNKPEHYHLENMLCAEYLLFFEDKNGELYMLSYFND
jgi:hypothetical protein